MSRKNSQSVWQIPADDQRNLLLFQLLARNLEWVGHCSDINQDRRIPAVEALVKFLVPVARAVCPTATTHLIWSALVPSILAFSYLVIYGVVVRWSLGTCLLLRADTEFFCWDFAAAAALGSPDSTML